MPGAVEGGAYAVLYLMSAWALNAIKYGASQTIKYVLFGTDFWDIVNGIAQPPVESCVYSYCCVTRAHNLLDMDE